MQTDNQLIQKKCRKRQKVHSEKNEFEVSNISCKIEFYIFFIINCNSLKLRDQ